MTDEEKKAIEDLKGYLEFRKKSYGDEDKEVKILLNLTEKQKKEIEEKTTIILAGAEKVKMLEKEIEKLNIAINKQSITISKQLQEIEEKSKLINSMKKFLLDTRLMADYLEREE